MLKTVLMLVVLTGISAGVAPAAFGGVQFYDDEALWRDAWRGDLPGWPIGEYPFDAVHLEPIIGHLPAHGENLGHPLVFPAVVTSMPADFTANPEPPVLYDFVYWGEGAHGYGPMLSIGGPGLTDDDWVITFGDGVYAFAVDVTDSNETPPWELETFCVYGPGDVLLGCLDSDDPESRWPVGAKTFLGVISTEPIARVIFDDEAGGIDNIGLGKIWLTDDCDVGNEGAGFDDASSWATYDYGDDCEVGVECTAPDGYSGAVFDGRYVYFSPEENGYGEFHAEVLRYDTQGEFSDPSSWETFDAGAEPLNADGGYIGIVFDGQHVYFVPYLGSGASGEVLRYDTTQPFSESDSWETFDAEAEPLNANGGYMGAVFDGQHVYFVPYAADGAMHGEVLRYDIEAPFQDASSWETFDAKAAPLNANGGYRGAVSDGQYVYFVPFAKGYADMHGEVLRYDMDDPDGFADPGSWEKYDYGNSAECAADPNCDDPDGYVRAVFDGQYVYFVPYQSDAYNPTSGEVLRYDTDDPDGFTDPGSWDTYDYGTSAQCAADPNCTDPDGYKGAVFDGRRFVYFVPHHNGTEYHGEVLRYDTWGAFLDDSSWATYDPGANGVGTDPDGYWGGAFDGQFIYFAPFHTGTSYPDEGLHGEVLRFDTFAGWSVDCNDNGIPDECDIADCDGSPWCSDCNGNGIPDECEVPPLCPECPDCNGNGVPDECEPDCDGNGIIDDCDDDIDGDGVLNGDDVCPLTPFCESLTDGRPRLDMNNDCEVNGLDIQIIVEQMLNGCTECD